MTFSPKNNLRTENHYAYIRLHLWVNRELGKADHCENDPSHQSPRFHWANISGEYKKDLSDWRQLCPSCNIKESVSEFSRESSRIRAKGNQYHAKPVLKIYPNGSWIKYASTRIASEVNNITRTCITNALSGRTKTAGGFRWKQIGG